MGYRNSSGTSLPTKFAVPTAEQHRIARDLGALFDRVGLPRYAGLCTGPVTESVLDAYHTGGRTTGITAYRKALHGGGVEPPDIPGVVTWDGVLGVEEHTAFWALADHLEKPSPPAHTPPGAAGGGSPPTGIARDYLTVGQLDLGGDSHLDRIHTERRARWADSRCPERVALTEAVAPVLTAAAPVPGDAKDHLAQIRWFLTRSPATAPP